MSDQQLDTFEQQLKRLETLVNELERGDLALEDALKKFEEGVTLTKHCQKTLAEAEQRVVQLSQTQNTNQG